jgi:Ca-activated chloride channel family protein
MAGRHQQTSAAPRAGRLRLVLILVGVVVLAAAGTLTVVLLRSSNKSTAAGGASSSTCASGVTLQVAAAPAIAPVLSEVATNWAKTKPVVDGACPTVVVRSVTGATEAVALAKPDVTLPDVWVPDSSLWIQQLKADTAGIDAPVQSLWSYPSIASSPLVLATTSANLAAVTASAATGWAGALAATAPVSMLDPTTSTDGLTHALGADWNRRRLPGTDPAPGRADDLPRERAGGARGERELPDPGHPSGQFGVPDRQIAVARLPDRAVRPGRR